MSNSPVSYALPTRENVEPDEDWSRIVDRKKKKRVQNRVAQREYRRRTRELIEGLTAELDQYKRQAQETQGQGTQEASLDESVNQSTQPPPAEEAAESPGQRLASGSWGQQVSPEQLQPPDPCTRQRSSLVHQLPASIDEGQIGQPASTCGPSSTRLSSLIQPRTSTPSSLALPLSSSIVSLPQTHQAIVGGTSDTLYPSSRHIPSTHEGVNVGRATGHHSHGTWQTLGTDASISQQPFHQEDSYFVPVDMAVDDDNDYGSDHVNHSQPGDAPALPMNLPSSTEHAGFTLSHDSQVQQPENQVGTESGFWDRLPGAESSLEHRLNFLFDWVQHAGFESLDNLLEVWYTTEFDDSSPLRQEQRLSRHRGLTALLAKLRASTHWSRWERWGYQQETLLGAESILRSEFLGLAEHHDSRRLVDTLSVQSDRDKAETLKDLRRCLQGELPELRTLLAAVNADSSGRTGRQASRRAVDAAMICLCLIGRVPDADFLATINDVVVA